MRNYPEWMLAYWACMAIGATCVGMNAWWATPELEYAIKDAKPKVIIADEERLKQLMDLRDLQEFPKVVAVRSKALPQKAASWHELVDTDSIMPSAQIDPDSDACIFYTSGTTGRPKGARLTHRGCVANAMSLAFAHIVQSCLLYTSPSPRD